jgi:hypothetical protein
MRVRPKQLGAELGDFVGYSVIHLSRKLAQNVGFPELAGRAWMG